MEDGLCLWVVYREPSDYPGKYVVRCHWSRPGGRIEVDPDCATFDSLEAARDALPPGLFNMHRQPDDDPVIVEVWL